MPAVPATAADPGQQWVVLGDEQNEELEQSLSTDFAADPVRPDDSLQPATAKTPTPEQMARARFRGPKPLPFHSVSRNITYGETLYPEMGFWIPSVFRQSEAYRFTSTSGSRPGRSPICAASTA